MSAITSPWRARIERTADALVPPFLAPRREQIQYLAIGAWNTVFGYGVWAVLNYLLQDYLNYLVIVALSYPVAITNAYVCYRYVVFRSHGPVLREIPRFSTVYLLTLLANIMILPILLRLSDQNVYVLQAAFTIFVVIASYAGHRLFSFHAGSEDD